jgi:hypothetical protein
MPFISGNLCKPAIYPSTMVIQLSALMCYRLSAQVDDGSGMKREATVEDLIKTIEELTRIH